MIKKGNASRYIAAILATTLAIENEMFCLLFSGHLFRF
jgi:hypothetical protein